MDREQLIRKLEALDGALNSSARLYLYGGGVFILLGEPGRTSVDLDVAGPYSEANMAELRPAAERVGFPVNPDEYYVGDHIEWVGPLRLCLPEPKADAKELSLWKGRHVEALGPPPADLVASKLIRYDEGDRADLQFLYSLCPWDWEEVRQAVQRLPKAFREDAVVKENLHNLKIDMQLWAAG